MTCRAKSARPDRLPENLLTGLNSSDSVGNSTGNSPIGDSSAGNSGFAAGGSCGLPNGTIAPGLHIGPGESCSPRHRMSSDPINEGLVYNRPISVYRLGEMPVWSCRQSLNAQRGRVGAG